jgi:hypothetical protein
MWCDQWFGFSSSSWTSISHLTKLQAFSTWSLSCESQTLMTPCELCDQWFGMCMLNFDDNLWPFDQSSAILNLNFEFRLNFAFSLWVTDFDDTLWLFKFKLNFNKSFHQTSGIFNLKFELWVTDLDDTL